MSGGQRVLAVRRTLTRYFYQKPKNSLTADWASISAVASEMTGAVVLQNMIAGPSLQRQ